MGCLTNLVAVPNYKQAQERGRAKGPMIIFNYKYWRSQANEAIDDQSALN